jgi:sec-independent protein translocase protein TatA
MDTFFLLFNMGGTEVFLIVFAVLLLFGGKKIPELMRGIGKGVREFNTAKDSLKSEIEEGMREPVKKESSAETK